MIEIPLFSLERENRSFGFMWFELKVECPLKVFAREELTSYDFYFPLNKPQFLVRYLYSLHLGTWKSGTIEAEAIVAQELL